MLASPPASGRRAALVYHGCPVLPPPEVLVSRVHERVTDGVLTDEATREFIDGALARLIDWVDADAAR